jgi:glucose dehydrogenase
MFNVSYLAIAAFGFGLVVTLVLAAWLTPARWWRQLNARALAIVGVGTWGIGTMVLALAQPPAPTNQVAFRVYEDLNLRAAKGTQSARIAVVPAGSVVTTTGAHDGDWWQVSAHVDGKEVRGWSSSLWLRRPDE